MNAKSMQMEFERLVQITNPEYLITNKLDSDTIFYFLNAAQNRFIKLNYMSLDGLRGTVENMRKAADAFKALIITISYTDTMGVSFDQEGIYGKRYKLPSNAEDRFFLYLRSSSYVSGTYMDIPDKIGDKDNKVLAPNKLIENEEVEKILTSYFNKPILRQPCCVLEGDALTLNNMYLAVYIDSYTKLKGITLTYIRKPRPFNVINVDNDTVVPECELAENVHQDIVELAVEMFITEAAYRVSGGDRPDRRSPNSQTDRR